MPSVVVGVCGRASLHAREPAGTALLPAAADVGAAAEPRLRRAGAQGYGVTPPSCSPSRRPVLRPLSLAPHLSRAGAVLRARHAVLARVLLADLVAAPRLWAAVLRARFLGLRPCGAPATIQPPGCGAELSRSETPSPAEAGNCSPCRARAPPHTPSPQSSCGQSSGHVRGDSRRCLSQKPSPHRGRQSRGQELALSWCWHLRRACGVSSAGAAVANAPRNGRAHCPFSRALTRRRRRRAAAAGPPAPRACAPPPSARPAARHRLAHR